jgi:hypothetical protein
MIMKTKILIWLVAATCPFLCGVVRGDDDVAAVVRQADQWRAEHRIIDLHQHMDYSPALLARAIRVLDASGVGLGIDLTPGTVTPGANGEPSEFERNKKMEDTLFPWPLAAIHEPGLQ